MAAMASLLGPVMTRKKTGEVSTEKELQGKTVGLYFSAHWCPPCKMFTPKLGEVYESLLKDGKPFEVVFISSDRSEEDFNSYFEEQANWLALPFADRDRKAAVSNRFKVRGIPTLVILDGDTGKIINENGHGAVCKPENFPWKPPSLSELIGDTIERAGGVEEPKTSIKDSWKLLYFSAEWCGPCRSFTPKLIECYNAMKSAGKSVEVIFCSMDRDEKSFDKYFGKMPWAAMPYDRASEDEGSQLAERLEVDGIPSLVLLDPSFEVKNNSANARVTSDPTGESFPEGWLTPAVANVDDDPSRLNGNPCVVALCGQASSAADATKAMEDIAKATEDIFFLVSSDPNGNVSSQLRRLVNAESKEEKMILFDLDDDGAYYDGGNVNHIEPYQHQIISSESVKALVDSYKKKTAKRMQAQARK